MKVTFKASGKFLSEILEATHMSMQNSIIGKDTNIDKKFSDVTEDYVVKHTGFISRFL